MKLTITAPVFARGLSLGTLLLSAAAASASTTLTFQVDMSNRPLSAGQSVVASGSFDGWAALGNALTNDPGSTNPYLYTGTFNDTADANGKVMDWQFRIIQGTGVSAYSGQADGDNYCVALPSTNGGSLVLLPVFWSDDGATVAHNITFQVDMAEQLQLGNFSPTYPMFAYGSFGGWATTPLPLTNNPALNVTNAQGYITSLPYQGTLTTWMASPNAAAEFKYVYQNGHDVYENVASPPGDPDSNPAPNRFFQNTDQVMPIVWFNSQPFSDTVTNTVTFIVDMSVQIYTGHFDGTADTVQLFGDYNAFANGTVMANTNPANTNLYYTTVTYVEGAGSTVVYKYQIDPGGNWENPAASNLIGNNRFLTLLGTNGSITAGPVYFSDLGPSSTIGDISITNCMVTFTVDMTPAVNLTVDSNLSFTVGFDTVSLNGLWNGVDGNFWTWSTSATTTYPQYVMTNIPGGNLYTITLPVNQGQPYSIYYDYGIDGLANEPNGNHSHYIRSLPNYTMPTDVFGSPAPGEASFGNLTVSQTSKQVSLSWLGRTGVRLQSTTNLTPPIVWTQLPLTDGTNLIVNQGPGTNPPVGYAGTNYDIGGGNVFYELIGPK